MVRRRRSSRFLRFARRYVEISTLVTVFWALFLILPSSATEGWLFPAMLVALGLMGLGQLGVTWRSIASPMTDDERDRLRAAGINPAPYEPMGIAGLWILSAAHVLAGFAWTYWILSFRDPVGAFTEPLSRLDAFYFALAIFTTTGFGDVAPTSDATRLAVSAQMAVDLVSLRLCCLSR